MHRLWGGHVDSPYSTVVFLFILKINISIPQDHRCGKDAVPGVSGFGQLIDIVGENWPLAGTGCGVVGKAKI
jgi:hypothetical protein